MERDTAAQQPRMPPWTSGPAELFRHAESHRTQRGDTDRRLALIGYDNTIEVCIDTYDVLLDLARAAEGETLRTVTGKAFTVTVRGVDWFFTPASSGQGQSDGPKAAGRFVERYNATGSSQPGEYVDVTRNVSYLIGLIRWAGAR